MRWIAPVVLAAVFAFAGGAKLAARPATAEGFRGLGLPRPADLALGVPAVELLAAATLIAYPVAGAVLALAMLLAFTVLLVLRLGAGSTAPCRCFGDVRSRPIAWTDVVRNLVLAALALLTLALPPG